jgi:hypothetical protein
MILSIVIQLTKSSAISAWIIEYVSTWSTFIGSIAAFLIVLMAVITFWQQRRSRRIETKGKINKWAMHFAQINETYDNVRNINFIDSQPMKYIDARTFLEGLADEELQKNVLFSKQR